MNVVFVTHRYPPHTGGVESHVREIAVRLAERGHDVTVLSADATPETDSRSTDEGVEVRRFRSASIGGSFHATPQIASAIRRVDSDVVHAHNYHSLPLFFAALGITDERFIVTTHYHGASTSSVRDRLLSLYRPFGSWVLRRADEVIAVSNWEQSRLNDRFGVDATVIPNGLDIQRFTGATPEKRDNPYLLCVGRLEMYKGVQHAIRALPELSGIELVVAGSGSSREKLEAIATETGVEGRVTFLGYVPDERLPGLYAGATAHVQLSEFEAYGMTVAEALASGTPCVVRTGSALDDWVSCPGVSGISDVSSKSIACAVETVRGTTLDEPPVLSWDDVTDRVAARY